MINFHDVLLHKGLACGPLWLDEEVHRIAKELQIFGPLNLEIYFLELVHSTWKKLS